MNELESRLRQADRLSVADLWPDIEGREPTMFPPQQRGSRRLMTIVAALAIGAGAFAVVVIAFSGSQVATDTPNATQGSLEAEGTSFALANGWNGSADSLPGYTRRIFQIATFPLPPLGDIAATDARASIGRDDVLIVMHEFSSICPPCPSESSGLPIVLGPLDLADASQVPKWLPPLDDVPEGHAIARRVFNIGPRYFDLWVEFGGEPIQGDFDRVNAVIGSLAVGEWVPEPNGSCQWNELGMLDPDCPQPQWLREVLVRAGFTISREGGTFVARIGSAEFFIWVQGLEDLSADHLAALEDRDLYPVRESVQGLTVYGNAQGWEWMSNGLHVNVSEGPFGDSRLPDIEELRPLVRASIEVEYEGACSFLDPGCPDHTLLVDMLERSGFTMAGDTGSALLAEKGPLLVTAFVADPELPASAEPNETIAGTVVTRYDDDTVYWKTLSGRQVVIRIQTRNGRLDHPTLVDLVEASQAG